MNARSALALWTDFGPRGGVRHSGHAIEYLWKRHVLQRPVLRRRVWDYELELDLKDPGISKTLAIFGKRELEHRWILERVLQQGMVVWDLGANIGYYAVMAARLVGPSGTVYAVEPAPANAALLRRNIALNGCERVIMLEEVAISNQNGTATFHLAEMSNVHTLHPTVYRSGSAARLTGSTIAVRTVDVPTFLTGKRSVDLVRMDIEGHEVEVFESIAHAVRASEFRARVLFEAHFPKYDDGEHNMRERLRALFALGYHPAIMASTDERRAAFHTRGYVPECRIRTDGVTRGIYRNVRPDDAIAFLCDLGGVRTVLLEHAT